MSATSPSTIQTELPIERRPEADRNATQGGRSFYFFDFDDNVAFLSTPAFIFHKETGAELKLSSGEYAQHSKHIGRSGAYADYRIDFSDQTGTFRAFRDQDFNWLQKLRGHKQIFIQDLAAALGYPDLNWKGPSWSCFYHAALNQRPVSVITARGHSRQTIKDGIKLLVREEHLPQMPNFLSIYPVSNPEIREELGDGDFQLSVAALKKRAIRASVQKAVESYGYNPYHRFGMSDDDPHNIELIADEMRELKAEYPQMSFFVIETQQGRFVKWEVYADRLEPTLCTSAQDVGAFEQLSLFPS